MTVRITSVAFSGVEARPVDVQVQLTDGLPGFAIVGLADKAVAESKERVRGALHALGISLPLKRVTVNLAPADLPKEGSHYDLPIALAVLGAMGILPHERLIDTLAMGELSLDGRITAIMGALPAAITAHMRGETFICPEDNGAEAAWASPDLKILAAHSLMQIVSALKTGENLPRPEPRKKTFESALIDLQDVKGQDVAKRALEIAAAGGHNLLMSGPPGSGKSMLAARLATILPPLSPVEILEVSMIQSIAGELKAAGLSEERPFRAPHHSASMPALVGGGLKARPGEASLAHKGVLFLDELPEFQPKVLDALRQPLETGEIVVSRANHHVTYPAQFQLIAAMNPCSCGLYGEPGHTCKRGERCKDDYQARLSGPFLDRIDLHISVPRVSVADINLPTPKESSKDVAARVLKARERQKMRFSEEQLPFTTNAEMHTRAIDTFIDISTETRLLLNKAAEKFHLSARSYHRILKVARTIADLEGNKRVEKPHVAEALSFRSLNDQKSPRRVA